MCQKRLELKKNKSSKVKSTVYYRIIGVAIEQSLKLWADGPLLFHLFLCKLFFNSTFWEVLLSNKELREFSPKRIFHLLEGKSDANRSSLRKAEKMQVPDERHCSLQQPKSYPKRRGSKPKLSSIFRHVSITQIRRSWKRYH